mmetsp:Transcript_27304/g.12718  ORF Transcript_27304/g.12718 Transcript_27304/m.12718 type:complete len:159 (-) Transcript_27304:403-879(-)
MVLKLLGLGVIEYSRDRFNLFDAFIVIVSTLDVVISLAGIDLGGSANTVTAFRTFRLLRVFKLARSWVSLRNLLVTIGRTLKDISNFSILLFIIIFIYTLVGMEIFAYKMKFNEEGEIDENGKSPRTNFDTVYIAFTSIFIVLTGENWNAIMYDGIRS